MKKRNEKGFVLAEAIVVAVFVLSLFTFLFSNLVPLVGQYEAHEKYDTIDGVYNTNIIRTMIMTDPDVNTVLKLGSASYIFYEDQDICAWLDKTNFCKKLLNSTYLDVKAIYVTWYRTADLKRDIKNNPSNFPRAFREYVDTIDTFTQPTNSAYDKYKRIIVHYNDGSFANLEIKLKEV